MALQCIIYKVPPHERLTDAEGDLQRLRGLHNTNQSRDDPQDTYLASRRYKVWRRRYRKETSQAGPPSLRMEDTHLSLKLNGSAVYVGLT
jgi:hypothetical protein